MGQWSTVMKSPADKAAVCGYKTVEGYWTNNSELTVCFVQQKTVVHATETGIDRNRRSTLHSLFKCKIILTKTFWWFCILCKKWVQLSALSFQLVIGLLVKVTAISIDILDNNENYLLDNDGGGWAKLKKHKMQQKTTNIKLQQSLVSFLNWVSFSLFIKASYILCQAFRIELGECKQIVARKARKLCEQWSKHTT